MRGKLFEIGSFCFFFFLPLDSSSECVGEFPDVHTAAEMLHAYNPMISYGSLHSCHVSLMGAWEQFHSSL